MRSKKALYNIITNLILQFIIVLYGFIVPKIIISRFGSNTNGLISSITQFLAYITLLESGFGPVVKATLYKPIANNDKVKIKSILKTAEKFFRTIAIIFFIYIIILAVVYPKIVNNEFDVWYTVTLIVIISISTFAEYFFGMTYKLFLQAEQEMYVISIIQMVTYFLSTLSIVILVKLNASVHIIKLVSGLIFVLRPIIQNLYVKKRFKIDLTEVNEKFELKEKWDGLAQHIASVIHGNTDITVLTIFSTLAEVSVYSVYYLVIKGVKSIVQVFSVGIDASWGDMIAKKEHENLNKKFNLYEIIYFSICTIIYTSTIVLIVPFIKLYTRGITDVNYVRYAFGCLIVISEYIWAIRLPYSSITLAAGHFKETRNGAWIEASSNIVISIVLVIHYGIIGVAIGTIVAMTIRTIEFVYHTNKYILKRSITDSIKKIGIVVVETILIVLTSKLLLIEANSYYTWVLKAMLCGCLAIIIVGLIDLIVYRKNIAEIKDFVKRFCKKKKVA